MSKDFATNPTCSIKVDVYTNSQGNIIQPGETVAGKKTFTFSGIKSDVTIDETINTENSTALHNGIAGFMWLFCGTDERNFDELSIKKTTTEVIEED
ncbi:MAG: hypothetical protein IK062_08100 [Selenomonadaceae bacterium]|nr:hypothetical protein [Selenomonadaceae bacterium]